MASVLKVDEMQGVTSAGDITITGEGGSATQSLQQGVAKGWVALNGTGTAAIRDSFNTASITDNSTGNYSQTYTNNMNNTGYTGATHVIVTTNGDCTATAEATLPTTSQFRVGCRALSNVLLDPQNAMIQIVGDLA